MFAIPSCQSGLGMDTAPTGVELSRNIWRRAGSLFLHRSTVPSGLEKPGLPRLDVVRPLRQGGGLAWDGLAALKKSAGGVRNEDCLAIAGS